MKTLLFFFLLSSTAAQAAFVACSPRPGPIVSGGVVGSTTFTCSPDLLAGNFAGDGLNVGAIQLVMNVSIQTQNGTPFTPQSVQAVMTNSAGFNNPAPLTVSGVTSVAGSLSTSATCPVTTTAVPCPDVVGPFTVTVFGVPVPGVALPFDGTVEVFYQALECATVASPEPSSFALLGAAALVLARRAARKR